MTRDKEWAESVVQQATTIAARYMASYGEDVRKALAADIIDLVIAELRVAREAIREAQRAAEQEAEEGTKQ